MWKVMLTVALVASGTWAAPQRFGGGGPVGGTGDKDAVITSQQLQVDFDGNYVNNYETSNGISHQETGQQQQGPEGPVVVSQGSTSYTAPNGEVVSIQYQANENGFVAQGSHIPTPPPIPPEILKALEYNAAHPEEDDLGLPGGRQGPPQRG